MTPLDGSSSIRRIFKPQVNLLLTGFTVSSFHSSLHEARIRCNWEVMIIIMIIVIIIMTVRSPTWQHDCCNHCGFHVEIIIIWRSTASSVSSVRTIIHSLNKIVNHKGEVKDLSFGLFSEFVLPIYILSFIFQGGRCRSERGVKGWGRVWLVRGLGVKPSTFQWASSLEGDH